MEAEASGILPPPHSSRGRRTSPLPGASGAEGGWALVRMCQSWVLEVHAPPHHHGPVAWSLPTYFHENRISHENRCKQVHHSLSSLPRL